MSLVGRLMLAAAILACRFSTPVRAGDTATAYAHTNLKMLTMQPFDQYDSGSFPGKKYASAEDENGRELVGGFMVHGYVYVLTEMGTIHMYSNLSGNKHGGVDSLLEGIFEDTVTANWDAENPMLYGVLRFHANIHGIKSGEGAWHGGDVSLKITIHNSGTFINPKNTTTTLSFFDGWGNSLISPSNQPPVEVQVGRLDKLTIRAVQTLKAFAYSADDKYVFDLANFEETTHFYIDTKTAGVTLTSVSGHDYSTPKTGADPKAWALYD